MPWTDNRGIPWFRKDTEHTATGFRWLDTLSDPYWRLLQWWWERRFWRLMAVGDETWRRARDRTRAYYRAHPELFEGGSD